MSRFERGDPIAFSGNVETVIHFPRSHGPSVQFDDAVAAFRAGDPVLIHDAIDREGETDLVYPTQAITPNGVARQRNDASGLTCVPVADRVIRQWDLPFLQEALDHPATESHDLGYDDRSSFSLTVNHRDTYTGITDGDRALTISSIGRTAPAPEAIDFSAVFHTPGHVHLLRAAPELLADRQGHAELGVTLTEGRSCHRPWWSVRCSMTKRNVHSRRMPRRNMPFATTSTLWKANRSLSDSDN